MKITNAVKTSPQAILQYGLQELLLNTVPTSFLFKLNLKILASHHLTFTNVPGPQQPLYFLGKEIVNLQGCVVGCRHHQTFVSYNGNVNLTWTIDLLDIEKPHLLDEFLHEELEALREALNVED